MGRLHQSQSAPQLTGSRLGSQSGSDTRPRLVNAHRVGIRALATMAACANDETRQYSKYSQVGWGLKGVDKRRYYRVRKKYCRTSFVFQLQLSVLSL